MDEQPSTVRVDEGSFLVADAGEIEPDTLDFSTGLIATMSVGAMICTGAHTGHVRVRAAVFPQPPATPALSGWDDVCEASVYAPRGDLRVASITHGPVVDLPLLSQAGPGWYRLRACVQGRDTAADVCTEPAEDYLLTCWPAPAATPLILRATDGKGLGLRRNEMHELDTPPEPAPHERPDQQTPAQAARENLLKRRRR